MHVNYPAPWVAQDERWSFWLVWGMASYFSLAIIAVHLFRLAEREHAFWYAAVIAMPLVLAPLLHLFRIRRTRFRRRLWDKLVAEEPWVDSLMAVFEPADCVAQMQAHEDPQRADGYTRVREKLDGLFRSVDALARHMRLNPATVSDMVADDLRNLRVTLAFHRVPVGR